MGRSKRTVDLILRLWPLYKLGLWLGRQPAFGKLIQPVFSSRIHQVTMLPVNEPIPRGEQVVLPYTLLAQLVERTSARFIMHECMCRLHETCQHFPVDLGCLFLGDGAALIHPTLGRLCSVDEAQQHILRGMQAGLYPLIAHTMIDSFTLGIPYRRMLTVCFCCECCCVVQRGLRKGPASLLNVVQKLPGLSMLVGDECVACGECLPSCPVSAISLNGHGVEINGKCKGCGICVRACPLGAIRVELDRQVDLLSAFRERMSSYADISGRPAKMD